MLGQNCAERRKVEEVNRICTTREKIKKIVLTVNIIYL